MPLYPYPSSYFFKLLDNLHKTIFNSILSFVLPRVIWRSAGAIATIQDTWHTFSELPRILYPFFHYVNPRPW
jgi:hypothetical protein